MISRCYNWAGKRGYLQASPIRDVEKPRADRPEHIITLTEYDKLVGACQGRRLPLKEAKGKKRIPVVYFTENSLRA